MSSNKTPIFDFISGTTSGALATTLLHPLDTLKVRFQAAGRGQRAVFEWNKTIRSVRNIIAKEGFSSLYKGLSAAIWGSGSSWGIYFFVYNRAKRRYQKKFNSQKLSNLWLTAAATEAGVIQVLMTNPIWMMKTRLQLQAKGFQLGTVRPYRGMIDGLITVARTEGLRAWYIGVVPSLWLISHGTIQFLVYDNLKYAFFTKNQEFASAAQGFWFGALSKIIASTITYPFQVVKTRLVSRENLYHKVKYRGMIHAFVTIAKTEGWAGFYRGLIPNTLRVTPYTALTFMFYERIQTALRSWDKRRK